MNEPVMVEWTHTDCPLGDKCPGKETCEFFPTVRDRINMAKLLYCLYEGSDCGDLSDFAGDVLLLLMDEFKEDFGARMDQLLAKADIETYGRPEPDEDPLAEPDGVPGGDYSVEWQADVVADSPRAAALEAERIQQTGRARVFDIFDEGGFMERINLDEDAEDDPCPDCSELGEPCAQHAVTVQLATPHFCADCEAGVPLAERKHDKDCARIPF